MCPSWGVKSYWILLSIVFKNLVKVAFVKKKQYNYLCKKVSLTKWKSWRYSELHLNEIGENKPFINMMSKCWASESKIKLGTSIVKSRTRYWEARFISQNWPLSLQKIKLSIIILSSRVWVVQGDVISRNYTLKSVEMITLNY